MPVTNKDELVVSVKEQFKLWHESGYPYCYNTGAMGKQSNPKNYDWTGDENIVSASDFKAACEELKSFAKGYTLNARYAASGSLGEFNVWDLFIEPYTGLNPKMNYHIKLSDKM